MKGFAVKRITFLAAFVSALLLVPAGLHAEGLMSSVSFQPIPAGSSIFVRPLDNSDQNLALQKDFERALKGKGFIVAKDANLILTFETRDTAGSWSGGGPNRFLELSNNDVQTGVDAPRVRLNLFNSARGGILNPNRKDRTRTVTPSSFRIEVSLDDKTNGKCLWQGWSSADIRIGAGPSTTRTMIPALINGFGQTVKRKTFPLPQ